MKEEATRRHRGECTRSPPRQDDVGKVKQMLIKSFDLSPYEKEIIKLTVHEAGQLTVSVDWAGVPRSLAVILNGPGQVGYFAREDGPSPLSLAYTWTQEDLQKGSEWSLTILNVSGKSVSQVSINIECPGEEATEPASFQKLKAQCFKSLNGVTPGITNQALVIRPRDAAVVKPKLLQISDVLRRVGAEKLTEIKPLALSNDLIIHPGIICSRRSQDSAASSMELGMLGKQANRMRFTPPPDDDEVMQDEAVLCAEVVDFKNHRLILSEYVSEFTIIAKKIVAGPSSTITWSRIDHIPSMPKSYQYSQRQHDDKFINLNPTEHSSASRFHSPSGDNGGNGANGANGFDGEAAPRVKMIAIEFEGLPKIILRGGEGGAGEPGQRGENGGHGAKGLYSRGGKFNCKRGPGYGGNGGNGGDGGNGGKGGRGGQGGTFEIWSTYESLSKIGENGLAPVICGGKGAPGGLGGLGGEPGQGGRAGNARGRWCSAKPSRRGRDGEPGARGRSGLSFNVPKVIHGEHGKLYLNEINDDDFEELYTQPELFRLDPQKGAPGTRVKALCANLIAADELTFSGSVVKDTHFLSADQIVFKVPEHATGGLHDIAIQRKGERSNQVSFEVLPVVESVSPREGTPGESITVRGKAFAPGAHVLISNTPVVPESVRQDQIVFQVPLTYLDDLWIREQGGSCDLAVYNPHPSSERSNSLVFKVRSLYGLKFDPKLDEWSFTNGEAAGRGKPSWDTLKATFGSYEVHKSTVFEPLFWPFYAFYRTYARGSEGLCLGMASTCANHFLGGLHNIHARSLEQALTEVTIAFGHQLGIDQLRSFNTQVRMGQRNVLNVFHEIEDFFRKSDSPTEWPIISFIPSGTIWDLERLNQAHTVLPYKLVYERKTGALPARVYIYNPNYPEHREDFIRFFMRGGRVRFSYYKPGTNTILYNKGFTLGTTSLKFLLLDDVNMPISLLESGMLLLDTIFSPATVKVEDEQGGLIGSIDGVAHLEMADALVIPFAPNCFVLPFGRRYTRTITGTKKGTYSYSIASSEGAAVFLERMPTRAGSKDVILMSADGESLEITSEESKEFSVIFSQRLGAANRMIRIDGLVVKRGQPLLLWSDNDLEEVGIQNPQTDRPIEVSLRYSVFGQMDRTKKLTVPLASANGEEGLILDVGGWQDLSSKNLAARLLTREIQVPKRIRKSLGSVLTS